jgi:hypothetical protein
VAQKILHPANQFLRLKGFSDQFVGLHRYGAIGDILVDHTGHENHGCLAIQWALLNLAAHGIAVLVRHDYVRNDHVGRMLLKLRKRGRSVGTGNHVNVFAAKSDLDDFAHRRAVINEIDIGSVLRFRFAERGHGDGLAHRASLSARSLPVS